MDHPYLLLIRHANRAPCWNKPEALHPIRDWAVDQGNSTGYFEKPGLLRSYALAGRLCDQLEIEGISVCCILHSEHLAAEQTAKIFARVLLRRNLFNSQIERCTLLNPRNADDASLKEQEGVPCNI